VPETRHSLEQEKQVEAMLELYRRHPCTTGRVRPADRRLARDLCRAGISVDTVEAALLIATARLTLLRQKPATLVRSLHYFLPVIRELRQRPLDTDYLCYLRRTLGRSLLGGVHQIS